MRLHDAVLPPAGDPPRGFRQDLEPRFELGQLCITPAAAAVLPQDEVLTAVTRHARGDWGALTPEDRRANDRALREGGQLLSVYHTVEGVKFYVITEWDRTFTTVLLPEDY